MIAADEFLRVLVPLVFAPLLGPDGPAFLALRVEEAELINGTVVVAPDPRLRFLMTSVLRERGRTTPCSLRKRPQALQRGWPSGLRRHSGVVCVKQFVHVVGTAGSEGPPAAERLVLDPFGLGLPGRLGATELKPLMLPAMSGGLLGVDCAV